MDKENLYRALIISFLIISGFLFIVIDIFYSSFTLISFILFLLFSLMLLAELYFRIQHNIDRNREILRENLKLMKLLITYLEKFNTISYQLTKQSLDKE